MNTEVKRIRPEFRAYPKKFKKTLKKLLTKRNILYII